MNILALPDELLVNIIKFCDIKTIKRMKGINKRLFSIINEYEESESYANMLILDSIKFLRFCFSETELSPIIAKFAIELIACYSSTPHDKCCVCKRCFGCANCEKNFIKHITCHWNINNKLLFLYSVSSNSHPCSLK